MPDPSSAKGLIRNIASTTAFQASGYVLAMINVPYLTRMLGVADYGVLAFVISINAYLFLIIDWGFSLGSTRDIAQANGDVEDNPPHLLADDDCESSAFTRGDRRAGRSRRTA